ncbi:hypothetical protein LSO9J_40021 [Candidatus Liberibacter solanacearum]
MKSRENNKATTKKVRRLDEAESQYEESYQYNNEKQLLNKTK